MTGFKVSGADSVPYIGKAPGDDEFYGRDFADWLALLGSGVTITSATWTVDSGINKVSEDIIEPSTPVVRLSGGALGKSYLATCLVTASNGQKLERSIKITITLL